MLFVLYSPYKCPLNVTVFWTGIVMNINLYHSIVNVSLLYTFLLQLFQMRWRDQPIQVCNASLSVK